MYLLFLVLLRERPCGELINNKRLPTDCLLFDGALGAP